MDARKGTFTYTYSAKEQEEIKKIRDKYTRPAENENGMEKLRRLDASATKAATVVSVIVGIVSSLIMGVGLCCTMVSEWEQFFVPGIVVGAVGIVGIVAAYPIYKGMVSRKRKKLAPEIIRLTEELMK